MKIIYIHQYFLTPDEGGAIRSYHLAKGMVDAGIEVEMITAHNEPRYDIRLIAGIKVHYLPVAYDNCFGFFKRVYSFLRFVRAAKLLIKKLPRPDFLYITSTPLTTGMIGRWAKRKLAIPYFFEVRDLWPEAPIQMGIVNSELLKRFLYRFERQIYQDASHLISLSPGIRESMERTCPNKPITIIPNFADPDFFDPSIVTDINRLDIVEEGEITVSYAGAIGHVNGLGSFLELVKVAKDRGVNCRFVLMGKGMASSEIAQEKERLGLDNLILKPFGDKHEVRKLLADSDFVYLSFLPHSILTTGSPNKFFDAIAMGKPIILNFKGWIYDIVLHSDIGIYHDNGSSDAVFDYIKKISDNPEVKVGIQKRSLELACNQFSRKKAVKALLDILTSKKSKVKKTSGAYTLTA